MADRLALPPLQDFVSQSSDCSTVSGNRSFAVAQPLTIAHALIVAMTFAFTGWLIERGQDPQSALMITLTALAGAVVVTRVSAQGAKSVLRRLGGGA
ncbi:hypothetical protein AB0A63_28905 [Lentzea sp. NPDC042327]|uniref:hypothetical protein n=1 Tax=Lentzea sp. NPDC042327 TaxID=3154801 RepID=UPI0033CC531F